MAYKLRKTIYIGLGGTGVAALLKIKKCFMESYDEIPPMIGFLAIDTDGAALNKSETDNRGRRITLDPSELLVCTVKQALDAYHMNPQTYDWVPQKNVRNLANIRGGGAGQIRSNGRFIAYYNNEQIKQYIQVVTNKVNAQLPEKSKFKVEINQNGWEHAVEVNIFASVAGGTGSGMLIDTIVLAKQALNALGQKSNIRPWIVMPQVFRAMNSGNAMNNVLYNGYGALRELDYLIHHDPQTPPVNLGHTQVGSAPFVYAYIINNTNQAGTTFSTLDDIMENVAKCAFLPSNEMGDAIDTPFDNIGHQIGGGTYDILNKKAWAASTASVELIYDSHAVARAQASRIITQFCNTMTQKQGHGGDDANAFVDDQNVLIRENNGRDDVIDSLLDANPVYVLEIDLNTTEQDITDCIDNNCGQSTVNDVKAKLDQKLQNTYSQFDQKLHGIMGRAEGNVGSALEFISALKQIIGLCQGEMNTEEQDYQQTNSIPAQWDTKLSRVRNSGVKALFGSKLNEEEADAVRSEVGFAITNKREELRRTWAKKFYNSLTAYINGKEQQLKTLEGTLNSLSVQHRNKMLAEQNNNTDNKSNFQIYLHADDLMSVSSMALTDSLRTQFAERLLNKAEGWTGNVADNIEKDLWDFATNTTEVQGTLGTDIDNVIRAMDPDDVKAKLSHMKELASPMWTINTQGYNKKNFQTDKFIILGVNDRSTSVLTTDPNYKSFFDIGPNKTTFASTYLHDRIYLLLVEDTVPIYAVGSVQTCINDNDQKVADGYGMDNCMDEKLDSRMKAEKFSIKPTPKQSDVLKFWVMGCILGYIHFDENTQQYWIKSQKFGLPIKGFRYDLGGQRDVAFNAFKASELDKEVEDELDKTIRKNGNAPINSLIEEIQEKGNYYPDYSQMSIGERNNVDSGNPQYKNIEELINKEIVLVTTLKL